MTDTIEQKALALVREVAGYEIDSVFHDAAFADVVEAVHRAIEQHEAFRQEVSDAIVQYCGGPKYVLFEPLARFILPKPDPLVEAVAECDDGTWDTKAEYADKLRAAIEKRGGKIIFNKE